MTTAGRPPPSKQSDLFAHPPKRTRATHTGTKQLPFMAAWCNLTNPPQLRSPPPPLRSCRSPPFPIGFYAVSKTALLGLVKGLAAEMGPAGIRVNGVVREQGARVLLLTSFCFGDAGHVAASAQFLLWHQPSCTNPPCFHAMSIPCSPFRAFPPSRPPAVQAPGIVPTKFSAALVAEPALERAQRESTALKRLGTPEDIAGAVAFLVSPDGGWGGGRTRHLEPVGGRGRYCEEVDWQGLLGGG